MNNRKDILLDICLSFRYIEEKLMGLAEQEKIMTSSEFEERLVQELNLTPKDVELNTLEDIFSRLENIEDALVCMTSDKMTETYSALVQARQLFKK